MLDHIHDPLGAKFTSDMRDAVQMEKRACEDLSNEELSSLPDSAFAYNVEFGDRYYPCHTPEHIALSRAYLHKYHDDMPRDTFNKVASYLEDAAAAFGLEPWNPDFIKKAEEPVDEAERLMADALEFERGYRQMYVDSRRDVARGLYARAEAMDKTASLPHIVVRYARRYISPDYMRAIDDRRRFFAEGSPMRGRLLGIGLRAGSMGADELISTLRHFDEDNGLTAHYDDGLLDPYLALLGDEPPPSKVVYRDGDCVVYETNVEGGALFQKLKDVIGEGIIHALGLDFAGAIESVRPEMKAVILRALCG